MFEKAYTFDDIALVPKFNAVKSRLHVSLDTKLTRNITMNNPLIPSNMDTVISFELAQQILGEGSIPIFHRFCSILEQKGVCKKEHRSHDSRPTIHLDLFVESTFYT